MLKKRYLDNGCGGDWIRLQFLALEQKCFSRKIGHFGQHYLLKLIPYTNAG
jgi:hypothetical protein